jgi:hypothetical protein
VTIIAIDPGPVESAWVIYDSEKGVLSHCKADNYGVLASVYLWNHGPVIIEMIGHYGTGMPAGAEVFETCVWIGRFTEAAGEHRVHRLLRATIKTNICGSARAKDANVRQAIIDRFGGKAAAIGNKKYPGPLYGIGGDCWSALAVALTWCDQQRMKGAAA